MKRQIQTLTTLLTLCIVLLTTGVGCDQKSETTQRQTPLAPTFTNKEPPDPVPERVIEEPIVEKPAPTPLPAPDVLPDVPPPLTVENKKIWGAFITEAVKDPIIFEKIMPKTPKEAFKFWEYIHSYVESDYYYDFKKALWREMSERFPNDPEMLFMHSMASHPGSTGATREQKLAYIALWERLKKLNDAHNIPITSGLRKTAYLSQFYIDVGEYDKAIQNIKEQDDRIDALHRAGYHHDQFMYMGILERGTVIDIQKVIDKQKQEKNTGEK